jgi:WD40 repeat protein
MGALIFTPDGKELFAVQNPDYGEAESEVVRLKMASLFKPPVRVEEQTNPLTGRTYQTPIHAVRWNPVMTLPGTERIATAAISSDGRLLAVGGAEGVVHVADLKRKKTLASFPWEGRKPRDRAAVRVAFDPTAEWVAMLANGRLFARPLGAGNGWQTKAALGYAHDFAFHPEGRVLCAVFADGRARFLDPLTGAVRQTFAWAKRPKPLYSVAFAPDGLTCAAGGENGLVVVWDVDG